MVFEIEYFLHHIGDIRDNDWDVYKWIQPGRNFSHDTGLVYNTLVTGGIIFVIWKSSILHSIGNKQHDIQLSMLERPSNIFLHHFGDI